MKAKDNIEELILNNLKGLNEDEPLEGHFDRFEAKLNLQHKKKKFNLNVVWKVAAAVVFVLLVSNQAAIYLSQENEGSLFSAFQKKEVTLSSVSPEYQEVEFYYTSTINEGLNQWDRMVKEGMISEEEQNMMHTELNEFQTRYENLQKDLAANPNDERVINAMLEYYQAKLSVITMIVNKLEEIKQQTKNNHENEI